MFSGSLAFSVFVQQDSLWKDKVWAVEREAPGMTSCADAVPTGACRSLPGPLASMGAGCGHPAEKFLVRRGFFFSFLILNSEVCVKVFKVSSDEICMLAFFASSTEGTHDRRGTTFLELCMPRGSTLELGV